MSYRILKSAHDYPRRPISRLPPGVLMLNCRLVERTGRLLSHE